MNNAAPLASVRVVLALTVKAVVLIVKADVLEFSLMAVTLLPTPPVIVVVPLVLPELVIVPVLLTGFVDNVTTDAPVPLIVMFPVPVMPPLRVSVPELGVILKLLLSVTAPLKVVVVLPSILNVPLLPDATVIAFVNGPA